MDVPSECDYNTTCNGSAVNGSAGPHDYMMDEYVSWVALQKRATICLAVLYIFITVVGLVANGMVLYMIARSRRSKAVTSIYIFNLAIADMLYLVWLPAAAYQMFQGAWMLGHAVCKLYYTCDGLSKFASVMFLVVLSFDRYMAVCHPIGSRSVRTAKVAFATSGASWLIVTLAMVPVYVYAQLVQVVRPEGSTLQCVFNWPNLYSNSESDSDNATFAFFDNHTAYSNLTISPATYPYLFGFNDTQPTAAPETTRRIFTLYLFFLSFSIPLLMVWIFYVMILLRLWAQRRNLFANKNEACASKPQRLVLPANQANQRRRRSTRRVTIMVLSIVIAYTVCWIPYWFVQLSIEFYQDLEEAIPRNTFTVLSYVAYGMQSINSALNPFLYAFGTHAHRRRLMALLRRLFGPAVSRWWGVDADPNDKSAGSDMNMDSHTEMSKRVQRAKNYTSNGTDFASRQPTVTPSKTWNCGQKNQRSGNSPDSHGSGESNEDPTKKKMDTTRGGCCMCFGGRKRGDSTPKVESAVLYKADRLTVPCGSASTSRRLTDPVSEREKCDDPDCDDEENELGVSTTNGL